MNTSMCTNVHEDHKDTLIFPACTLIGSVVTKKTFAYWREIPRVAAMRSAGTTTTLAADTPPLRWLGSSKDGYEAGADDLIPTYRLRLDSFKKYGTGTL